MTADANRKRHQELLERDWESESVPFMAALQDDRFHKVSPVVIPLRQTTV
jgi:hypothetical protein